jgi:hypothetical protein
MCLGVPFKIVSYLDVMPVACNGQQHHRMSKELAMHSLTATVVHNLTATVMHNLAATVIRRVMEGWFSQSQGNLTICLVIFPLCLTKFTLAAIELVLGLESVYPTSRLLRCPGVQPLPSPKRDQLPKSGVQTKSPIQPRERRPAQYVQLVRDPDIQVRGQGFRWGQGFKTGFGYIMRPGLQVWGQGFRCISDVWGVWCSYEVKGAVALVWDQPSMDM